MRRCQGTAPTVGGPYPSRAHPAVRRALCDHAFVTWRTFVLSLLAYEVFLIGTQWLFLGKVSSITTIVFTAFFLVMMRSWTRRRPRPSGSSS